MTSADAVFLTAQIRDIEQQAMSLPKPPRLMEKAGLAAAQVIRAQWLKKPHRSIVVLAGPGNNGGDAFVVARYLREWGHAVTVVFNGDPNRVSMDAKQALQSWFGIGGDLSPDIPDGDKTWDMVVDGLFGIGLDHAQHRPIEGQYREWIEVANSWHVPIVSLDMPSGIGSDDGCIHGVAIRADMTVTFIGLKPGLFTNFGPEYCGTVILRDLDVLPQLVAAPQPHSWLLNTSLAQSSLPSPRRANSHKGSFGNVAILGGSTGMVGAALLAGRSALHLGAGRIYVGFLADPAPAVDFSQPELMLRAPSELFTLIPLTPLNCWVIGPGLSQSAQALVWLENALKGDGAIVLDADALNLVAQYPRLGQQLSQRSAATILTPHPAEAARLLNTDTSAVQNDRMSAAHQIAQQFNSHVVLKGAGSICCFPNGDRYLSTSGNPGLSTAGTGDVLSGMIAALIAQGLTPPQALLLGVHLHGAAADRLLQQNHGPVGMTASDIIASARLLLNDWIYHANDSSFKT
ncbi:MAG: NAD(P)H-hydrate dehydratase [Nitrosomonas sp.]|nr:NAD(P)H-hydrate dehydratase [Nitrosomonas sp.]